MLLLLACTGPSKDTPDDTAVHMDDTATDTHESAPTDDTADSDCTPSTWYVDADGDSYGDPASATESCGDSGLVADASDCDDTDPAVFPGAADTCGDGVDGDCDGADRACAREIPLADSVKVSSDVANIEAGHLVDVGDVNADGQVDVLLSTLKADKLAGGAWLLPGPVTASGTLGDLGFRLSGITAGDGAGRSIGLGDVDGDGADDIAVGVPFSLECREDIVFGPVTEDRSLADADVVLTAPDGSFCGHGSDVQDIDGDGVADALVGAYASDESGFEAGAFYVAYGPLTGDRDLGTDADAHLVGEFASAWTGRVVRGARDLNGDGLGDVLISAIGVSLNGSSSGAVYVMYGPLYGELALADGADGRLVGEGAYHYAGAAIGSGDIDGDGLTDVLVGAQSSDGGIGAGAAYVVLGPADGDRALADSAIAIRGQVDFLSLGSGVGAGDVDGDGDDDLVVGAPGDATVGEYAGGAYVFADGLTGALTPEDATAHLYGQAAGDQAGWGVGIADLDGDGAAEVLVGAPEEETGGAQAGALYVTDW